MLNHPGGVPDSSKAILWVSTIKRGRQAVREGVVTTEAEITMMPLLEGSSIECRQPLEARKGKKQTLL